MRKNLPIGLTKGNILHQKAQTQIFLGLAITVLVVLSVVGQIVVQGCVATP
jgi:hypothetical protein